MDIIVKNTSYQIEAIVDVYDSLIWTERYSKCGDFEIVLPLTDEMMSIFRLERYLQIENSDMTMIVEGIQIQTDAENGDKITVTGRSLESILDRRIVWGKQVLSGDFQNGIQSLLQSSIIKPTIANRKISNFRFIPSTDSSITSLKIDAQFTGDNIYDTICQLCEDRGLGFRVVLMEDGHFDFQLYAGADRSYDQLINPFVTFSPEFENLLDSTYKESTSWIKNITLIGGEDQGNQRRYAAAGSNTVAGLGRRELFTDARDIQSEITDSEGNEHTLSNEEYIAQLQQRGIQKLTELKEEPLFDCRIETKNMYIINKDFFKGDIVQISNGHGQDEKARITEVIISDDQNGIGIYPTFEVI